MLGKTALKDLQEVPWKHAHGKKRCLVDHWLLPRCSRIGENSLNFGMMNAAQEATLLQWSRVMDLNPCLLKAKPKKRPATQMRISLKIPKHDVWNRVNAKMLANGCCTGNRMRSKFGRAGKEDPLCTNRGLHFTQNPMCVPQNKADDLLICMDGGLQVVEGSGTTFKSPLHGRKVRSIRIMLLQEVKQVVSSVREKPSWLRVKQLKPVKDTGSRQSTDRVNAGGNISTARRGICKSSTSCSLEGDTILDDARHELKLDSRSKLKQGRFSIFPDSMVTQLDLLDKLIVRVSPQSRKQWL